MRLLALLMTLTSAAVMAQQANVLDDDLPHAFDDRAITLGATRPAPDVSMSWETVDPGAEDYLSCVVPSGSGLVVSSDPNIDRSGILAANAAYLAACSDDGNLGGGQQNECVALWDNGTDGMVSVAAGDLNLDPAGGVVRTRASDDDNAFIFVGTPARSEMWQLAADGGTGYVLAVDSEKGDPDPADKGQILLALRGGGSPGGRQLVIGDYTQLGSNFLHDMPVDPTVFFQGTVDPLADATKWGSLAFVGATDMFTITSGSPFIQFDVSGATNTFRIASSGVGVRDGVPYLIGTNNDAQLVWQTEDADAHALILSMPDGGAVNVPVLAIGDRGAPTVQGADLGLFAGIVDPMFAAISQDNAGYMGSQHNGTDGVLRTNLGGIRLQPARADADRSDGLVFGHAEVTTADDVPTTCASVPLLDENTYHLTGRVVGVLSTGAQRGSFEVVATVYRTGAGAATIQGTATSVHAQSSSAATATWAVSGNNAILQVTGVAASTYRWTCLSEALNMSN